MNARIFVSSILLIFAPQPIANAQVMGPQTAEGCIRVSDPRPKLSVSGRLTLQLFPGAPNFESIAAGDVEEQTFIVDLLQAARSEEQTSDLKSLMRNSYAVFCL